jgi:hypothetical protein
VKAVIAVPVMWYCVYSTSVPQQRVVNRVSSYLVLQRSAVHVNRISH